MKINNITIRDILELNYKSDTFFSFYNEKNISNMTLAEDIFLGMHFVTCIEGLNFFDELMCFLNTEKTSYIILQKSEESSGLVVIKTAYFKNANNNNCDGKSINKDHLLSFAESKYIEHDIKTIFFNTESK